MKVVIDTDFDAIGESAWNDLVRRSARATVFQSWSWQRAWWRAFHDASSLPRRLLLVSARTEDGALLAVAPLMVEEQGKRRTIKFVGDGQADALDFICDDLQLGSRERLLEELTQRTDLWDALALDAIPSDSPTVGAVREWLRHSGFSADWSTRASSPVLPVPVKQPAIAEGLSVALTRDPRVIAAALDGFFIQHIHRWSSRDVQSQFVGAHQSRDVSHARRGACRRRDASHDAARRRTGCWLCVERARWRRTLVRDVFRHSRGQARCRSRAARCDVRARS